MSDANPLSEAITTLPDLTHDQLTDMIDYVEYYRFGDNTVLERRKGKLTFKSDDNPEPKRGYYTPPPSVRVVLDIIDHLPRENVQIVVNTAKMLRDATAPKTRRRIDQTTGEAIQAEGVIVAKEIPKRAYDSNTGELISERFFYYLYHRQWATGGGRNRDEKRLKNKYLGCKELAHQLYRYQHSTYNGQPNPERNPDLHRRLHDTIFEAYRTGKLTALENRAPISEGELTAAESRPMLENTSMLPNKGLLDHDPLPTTTAQVTQADQIVIEPAPRAPKPPRRVMTRDDVLQSLPFAKGDVLLIEGRVIEVTAIEIGVTVSTGSHELSRVQISRQDKKNPHKWDKPVWLQGHTFVKKVKKAQRRTP